MLVGAGVLRAGNLRPKIRFSSRGFLQSRYQYIEQYGCELSDFLKMQLSAFHLPSSWESKLHSPLDQYSPLRESKTPSELRDFARVPFFSRVLISVFYLLH